MIPKGTKKLELINNVVDIVKQNFDIQAKHDIEDYFEEIIISLIVFWLNFLVVALIKYIKPKYFWRTSPLERDTQGIIQYLNAQQTVHHQQINQQNIIQDENQQEQAINIGENDNNNNNPNQPPNVDPPQDSIEPKKPESVSGNQF